eukprot:TRINITY_DN12638_c0_g1_i1.p1 TRINITY_DN12638_c0_g1~~TRINITY_DN12638_c0_g1_i1.p1  ORF type:complete len:681 (+),score=210.59 TRINITY_DN12638_c0_g1_i1:139-2181(+)
MSARPVPVPRPNAGGAPRPVPRPGEDGGNRGPPPNARPPPVGRPAPQPTYEQESYEGEYNDGGNDYNQNYEGGYEEAPPVHQNRVPPPAPSHVTPYGGRVPPPAPAPAPAPVKLNNRQDHHGIPFASETEATSAFKHEGFKPIEQNNAPIQRKEGMVKQGDEKIKLKNRIKNYLANDGPKLVFIILWVLGNAAVFGERYYYYYFKRPDVFDILGHGGSLARGSGAALKLNSALMFLTMLRNIISFLRATFLNSFLPLDKNIVFHRYIGWAIAFWTAVHVVSHGHNFENIENYKGNPANLVSIGQSVPPPTARSIWFTSIPGSTGHVILFAMVLMFTTAVKSVRGPMFNLFWYLHHFFIVYIVVTSFHGFAAALEPPTFWYWIVGPVFLYIIERIIRLVRGNQETILQCAVGHPSKVIELQLKKSRFNYKPGQYLFLNCPYIAGQEWHPFTITSAPEESFISVHIRVVGDWTGDLWNFMNKEKKLGVIQEDLLKAPDGGPIFRIDGPFGAASEDVFKFKTVMLVAGGIGVTPFASILKAIRFRLESGQSSQVTKVYFYWISRDRNAFEWFNDVLAALEGTNLNNFLEINIFLTGQLNKDEIKTVMFNESGVDHITGLRSPTYFGRPDWKNIFAEKSKIHQGSQVGVFFCGPAVLSKQLYKHCKKSTDTANKTVFKYHKENF